MTASPPPTGRQGAPAPLVVAASLVAVEAVLLVLYGLAEIGSVKGGRMAMGVTTSLFFIAYGAGLGYCAWALSRIRSWSRAPLVLAQMIQILVAWGFIGGSTTPVAIALIVGALLVLAGIFHPASMNALSDDESPPS